MTATNKSKLVNWDADFYKSLPDENCLYCLSKKQVYVLGQALQQVHWATRWYGDTSGLDFSAIAGELEGILGMSECGDYGNLFNLVNDLQSQIVSLQQTVENDGNPPPDATDGIDTPTYQNTSAVMDAPIGNVTVPCGTIAEKDALYAACAELANYIIAQQTDFFEIFQQGQSRLPELADGVVSAIPAFETLPIDELISAVGYFADEAEEIWEAVNTSDRAQDFACLLFCAALANDCTLTPELVLSAIQTKAPDTMSDFLAKSVRDVLAITIIGQPIGDEFYYSQIYIQLQIVLLGERWLSAQGWRPYEMRFLSGLNSPDNDWAIFCTDCPDWYYYEDFRFWTDDWNDGWIADVGMYNGEFVEGIEQDPDPDNHSNFRIIARKELSSPAILKGAGIDHGAFKDCGLGQISIQLWNNGVQVAAFSNNTNTVSRGYRAWSRDPVIEIDEIRVRIDSDRCDAVPAFAHLHGVRLWYASTSQRKGLLTLEAPPVTVNGSTSSEWWTGWRES